MLKNLGVVAFVAVLALQADPQANKTKQTEANQQPSAPVAPAGIKQSDSPSPQAKRQDHIPNDVWIVKTPDKDAFDVASLAISGVLAVVGIVGVAVGIATVLYIKRQAFEMGFQRKVMRRTLSTIRRQTNILADSVAAAKKSAEAADKNVELLISKERGRIFVELADFDIKAVILNTQVIDFKVIYHGQTISFTANTMVEFGFTDSENPPIFRPGSSFVMRAIYELPSLIPSGSLEYECTVRRFHAFDQFEIDQINHGTKHIHCYGFIAYKDFMGRDRHTTFCHTWKPKPPGIGIGVSMWRKSGPPEANEET
jgi:hypothetical protein